MIKWIAYYRKAVPSAIAALTVIGSSTLLHGTVQLWVSVIAAALAATITPVLPANGPKPAAPIASHSMQKLLSPDPNKGATTWQLLIGVFLVVILALIIWSIWIQPHVH